MSLSAGEPVHGTFARWMKAVPGKKHLETIDLNTVDRVPRKGELVVVNGHVGRVADIVWMVPPERAGRQVQIVLGDDPKLDLAPKRWEYRSIYLSDGGNDDLNEAGRQGWEVYEVVAGRAARPFNTAYLRRELNDTEPDEDASE